MINGHDLPIFVAVAPISNALWLFGSIGLAVSLKRAGRVPRAVYIGLPLVWIASIPLGQLRRHADRGRLLDGRRLPALQRAAGRGRGGRSSGLIGPSFVSAQTFFRCTNHSVNSRQRPSESKCITKQLS